MKWGFSLAFILLFALLPGLKAQEAKVVSGFDGGMMLHTGYISGDIGQLKHTASGMPLGVGGVARVHLREHWRIGAEGYVSVLRQLNNGSYIKYGWGGLLCGLLLALQPLHSVYGIDDRRWQ